MTTPDQITRRDLLEGAVIVAGASALPAYGLAAETIADAHAPLAAETLEVKLQVNGRAHALALDPRATLLDTLRERLQLTGTKKGCDHGQCGACTVHLDSRRVLACLTLAAQAEGASVATIEGLAGRGGVLHPMQSAFIEHDAFQCGYCTPGQIMSAVACVREGRARSDAEIREYMSGNICRCGAYPNIVAAIRNVAGREPAP